MVPQANWVCHRVGPAHAAVGEFGSNVWDRAGKVIDKAVTGGTTHERLASAQKPLLAARAATEGGIGLFCLTGDMSRETQLSGPLEAVGTRRQDRRTLADEDSPIQLVSHAIRYSQSPTA